LAHGTEALGQPDGTAVDFTIEQLQDLLAQCAKLGGKFMVVANPDVVSCSLLLHPWSVITLICDECFSEVSYAVTMAAILRVLDSEDIVLASS
jgi:hypothetical protein